MTARRRKRRRRGGRGRSRAAAADRWRRRRRARGGAVVTSTIADDDGFDLDQLDEETLERRRGKTRKGRPTGRYQMIVHTMTDGTIQMGVLEGRSLVEHYVSRPEDGATSIDGNIYLGKVQNVLPGHGGRVHRHRHAEERRDLPARRAVRRRPSSRTSGGGSPKIETVLKNGQSILVQVTKNPIGAKGARLTQDVSLAGRFVVMVPNQPKTYGISKRLPDDERKRLRKVLEGIRPENAGLIVRTAAEGATADELARDLARLQDQWRQISDLAARSKPGTLLYREPPLVGARHPRGVHQGVPRRRPRRPGDARRGEGLRRRDRAGALRADRALRRGRRSRSSSGSTCTSSCTRRSTARCGCRRVARSSSSAPRRSPSSTSTRARTSGSRTSRRPSSRTTWRPPTRSPASSGCATSAGSSSSTSSTWRSARTGTRW